MLKEEPQSFNLIAATIHEPSFAIVAFKLSGLCLFPHADPWTDKIRFSNLPLLPRETVSVQQCCYILLRCLDRFCSLKVWIINNYEENY